MRTNFTSAHETRVRMLIGEIIERLSLDLRGLVVLTEMGSGPYLYTPMIAALAGVSRVIALIKDSRYGTFEEISSHGQRIADLWGVRDQIEFPDSLRSDLIYQADIVTNLGFLRPIDAEFVSQMKPGAVVPYMREAWEYRPGDVDLQACRRHNIPIMGTNESARDLDIFSYSGLLALKMLFDAGLEVKDDHVLLISNDKFGDTIEQSLTACDAVVHRATTRNEADISQMTRLDAVLVATFSLDEIIIGSDGWLKAEELKSVHPACIVISFAGNLDVESLTVQGIRCHPAVSAGAYRMTHTLGALGPKPVIDLHAAGLKVGELMWRELQVLKNAKHVERKLAVEHPLCQQIPQAFKER
jgi:hypothetical protein